MANFSSPDLQCEDPNCPSNSGSDDIASYAVRETRNFCSYCAEKKKYEGVILPRDNPRRTMSCAQHGDRAKWFCGIHNAALCQDCKSHHQACNLEYTLEEATFRLRKGLTQVDQKQKEVTLLQKRISDIHKRFKETEEAIKATHREKERNRRARRNSSGASARRPERGLRTNIDVDEVERKMGEEEAKECLEQLNVGHRRANRLVMSVKKQCHRCLDKTKAAAEKIEQLLRDEDCGMDDVKATLEALEDVLKLTVDTHLVKVAEEFTRGIRYRRGSTSHIGLVEGCIRSPWYLSDTIILPQKIEKPRVRCIDNKEVALLDVKNKVVYRVNLQKKDFQRLHDGRPVADLICCPDGKIVCINDEEFVISVFSSQWQHLQDISLPGLVFDILAVGSSGNLLVRGDGRRLYAIKPTGTEMRIHRKNFIYINIDNIHDIKDVVALPSDHIIVKQHESTFIVLDGKGNQRVSINPNNWAEAEIAVDRTTGSSYVMYLDKHHKDFEICRISVAGAVIEEEVLCLRHLLDSSLPIHLDVFESNKIYICNGNKLFVFTMMSADDP